jgi:hypothetical protein
MMNKDLLVAEAAGRVAIDKNSWWPEESPTTTNYVFH